MDARVVTGARLVISSGEAGEVVPGLLLGGSDAGLGQEDQSTDDEVGEAEAHLALDRYDGLCEDASGQNGGRLGGMEERRVVSTSRGKQVDIVVLDALLIYLSLSLSCQSARRRKNGNHVLACAGGIEHMERCWSSEYCNLQRELGERLQETVEVLINLHNCELHLYSSSSRKLFSCPCKQ
jgi:hypothetical protein